MKRTLLCLILGMLVLGTVYAQGKRGTPQEAKELVKKAIAYLKEHGREKAFAAFSDLKGKFVDGDLYIFVYDLNGNCLAHGANPKMIGKNLLELKDADGKAFVKERIEIAKSKGSGWQDYKFTNPVSKEIEKKTAYIERVDDIIGCGAYKK
ncbi:MAG: cache domain-containing protein [Bacteroidetes bacterium]|nr:cache domain-containing protein [Bacteroidota bacterium]